MVPTLLAKLGKDSKSSFPSKSIYFFFKNQCPISGQVVMVVGVKREDILLEVYFAPLINYTMGVDVFSTLIFHT